MLQRLETSGREIGVDEAGRGCLLGPVVCCAVMLPKSEDIDKNADMWDKINDSKNFRLKKEKNSMNLSSTTFRHMVLV